MAKKEHWTCPYCNRDCTLGDEDINVLGSDDYIAEDIGSFRANYKIIVCPNPKCRQLTISGFIGKRVSSNPGYSYQKMYAWQLVPESAAKSFPEYIPAQLRNDYEEACLVKGKSPKASATLSRRCLQGIIRDFWGIRKGRLIDEIAALEDEIDSKTWEAIDSVRKVGNIGAHMEADVNLIIDVEPNEAALLIWLLEVLFEEWYISHHNREQKMAKIVEIANTKKASSKDES